MAKRKYKLKELQVRIPVPHSVVRSQELDDMAFEAAQRISSTPVKKFKFLGAGGSAFSSQVKDMVYSAYGTPKED